MGPDDAQRRQLRLALSMNGGVSLAVWIAGAVAEIDRIRRGDGFWGDLLEAAGYRREAQVDVMAGASAGGLNAVMLAEAIQADQPFERFFPLWLDAADIHRLVKTPSTALDKDARAVLDGRYFLHELHAALSTIRRLGDESPSDRPRHSLAVFASATLVRANAVAFRDVPGEPIHEARSDAYFHVARRGDAARGLDGFADGDDDRLVDTLTALAMIGRATSSLPGLFEPVRFDRATFGSRLVGAFRDDRTSVEVMDGGVIDNVPISRAIRAVYHIPATGRTRRVLLYLHPDPGGDGTQQQPKDPETFLEVVGSFGGKRSETIREDIELLRLHNDAVHRRQAQARVILERLLAGDASTVAEAAAQSRAVVAALLLRAAVDPASELNWHAPGVARVAPLLDAPDVHLSKDRLADAFETAVDRDHDLLVADHVHRSVSAVQMVLRMAVDENPLLDAKDALERLNDLQLACHLVTSFQLGRMLKGDAVTEDDVVERLVASSAELAKATVPPLLGDDATWRALADWRPIPAHAGGRALPVELGAMLDHALDALPNPHTPGLGCRVLAWLAPTDTRDARVQALADAMLPLRAEPVASDQHIDFIRIAGNVRTWASDRFVGDDPDANRKRYGDRIAGKQLHHLGAFFDRHWRENDLRWGQLDSVPALVDAILDGQGLANLRQHPTMLPEELRDPHRNRAEVQRWLVQHRQEQLLSTFEDQEPFDRWAKRDRRLASLLGGRQLTSSAMQGVTTAARVAGKGGSLLSRAGLLLLRPLILGVTGVALAGRWATAAITWTMCVLLMSRQGGAAERWVWWSVGVELALLFAALVEGVFKPVRYARRTWPPYLLALAGAATGLLFVINHHWLEGASPDHRLHWVWILPGLAAAAGAFALFFWMHSIACVVLAALAGSWYSWIAYTATFDDALWPHWWPFHSLWIAWLASIVGMPVLVGWLPAKALNPDGAPAT